MLILKTISKHDFFFMEENVVIYKNYTNSENFEFCENFIFLHQYMNCRKRILI